MEDKQNEDSKKKMMESLFGWVTTDDQHKEIVKKWKKRLCTTGK